MANTESFADNSKLKVIETNNLLIRGHLLRYANAAIQINNISLVSIEHLPAPRFPKWTAIMCLIGILFISHGTAHYDDDESAIGTMILIAGFVCTFIWFMIYHSRVDKEYLNIRMNSGDVYCLFFNEKNFMRQVLQLLANIIETGTTPRTNFHINVKDCEIRDNGSLVQVSEESGW